MGVNKEFLKQIRSKKSRFYLFDFHVHSPASYDVAIGSNFEGLSDIEKERLEKVPKSLAKNPVEYEKKVLEEFSIKDYYDLLVEHRNLIVSNEQIAEGEEWAFIGITDHNVCEFSTAVSKYSCINENIKKNRLVIFPGIELDINFTEPTTKNTVAIHVNLIFEPKTELHQIYSAIKDSSNTQWEFGNTLCVVDLEEFINNIRTHEYSAICIAAHVNSSKGIGQEARKCILNHLDAAILRTQAEYERLEAGREKDELEDKLQNLIVQKEDEDEIAFETLNLLGKCGFDALQVRGKTDEPYYYQLHRYKKELGRAVAIICSDAHNINSIFKCKIKEGDSNVLPYIKLNEITTPFSKNKLFEEIREKGLRYGETRVNFTKPGETNFWIEGIEIIPDANDASYFWSREELNKSEQQGSNDKFILPFSRNLNCIIGGRGSGKSALIEAISFIFNHEEFNQSNKTKDWYQRAKLTLSGCKIKICWKALNLSSFPKRTLFIEGYFDINDRHPEIKFSDANDEELLRSTVKVPTVDIFRIHDIEEAAEASKLRVLFDGICGEDISTLSDEINNIVSNMQDQRRELVELANNVTVLTQENSPIREFARRKYEFDKVNKETIKSKYEKLDQAGEALLSVNQYLTEWNKIISQFNLESRKKEIEKIIIKIKKETYKEVDEEKVAKPYFESIEKLIEKFEENRDDSSSSEYNILQLTDKMKEELNVVVENFKTIQTGISESIKILNQELISQGVEKGSQDRQAKKDAFEEAQIKLQEYEKYIKDFRELHAKREANYTLLVKKCIERSEVRKNTANNINVMLSKNLDKSVIEIECDAQPMQDKEEFRRWLKGEFDWTGTRYKEPKIQALLEKNDINPCALKSILIASTEDLDIASFIVDKPTAAEGKIGKDDIKGLIRNNKVYVKLEPEMHESVYEEDFIKELPEVIIKGITTFNKRENGEERLLLDTVLKLDEIILDDIPIIRLNDRPRETSLKKELDRLSPGQRCSAILPILLLTGTNPLIIDQPEDNLDNRLIRQVIVNVLASIKLNRQVIMATHNANLPVLGDAEQVVALRAIDEGRCKMEGYGSLDEEAVIKQITDIMEGGREAFQFRQSIYQSYWNNGAEIIN